MSNEIIQDGSLILKAIKFAQKKHKGQTRKVSGKEYITHPILVSYIIAQYKNSKKLEALICAGLLHDTVEDTNTTYQEIVKGFGIEVAQLVFETTSDPVEIKRLGKLEYLKNKIRGISSYGLFLKLCDRLGNMMDSPSDKSIEETIELLKYLRKARKLSKSHLKVVEAIEEIINKRKAV